MHHRGHLKWYMAPVFRQMHPTLCVFIRLLQAANCIKQHSAFFGENLQSVFLRETLSLCSVLDSQLFCFGLLRAWRSSCMSHALNQSCFSPWYLHLVPFGAIVCLSAGRSSPKVCGEWYQSWEIIWNQTFMVQNWLVDVPEWVGLPDTVFSVF